MRKKIFFVFCLLLTGFFLNVKALNNTLLNVDFPRNNASLSDELLVQGWVMSEVDNKVSISIDNENC